MSEHDTKGPARILIVEDDPATRDLLRTCLERSGYSVATRPHGVAALEYLREGGSVGLILLDLYMPVMDGWEFRQAQLADPALATVPVVVISAADDVLVEPIEAEQVLKKPLDLDALRSVARRHCGPPRFGS